MGDSRIFFKTAKGRVTQRHSQGDLPVALLEILRVIDGKSSIDTLTPPVAALEFAHFLIGVQTLERMGLIQAVSAEDSDACLPLIPLRPPSLETMVDVIELDPQESVLAWAAANRGARELKENGYFSNPMRPEQGRRANRGHRLRALVVDDDPTMVDLVTASLEENGYEVTPAFDVNSAESILQKLALPDLILLDVQMPGRSGFELLAWIRATSPFTDIPVIMVTSQTGDENVFKGLQLGADGYIFKPLKWEKLYDCIQSVLGS